MADHASALAVLGDRRTLLQLRALPMGPASTSAGDSATPGTVTDRPDEEVVDHAC
jgi:hypothetical protein